jgi:hypothetical protein
MSCQSFHENPVILSRLRALRDSVVQKKTYRTVMAKSSKKTGQAKLLATPLKKKLTALTPEAIMCRGQVGGKKRHI